MLALSANLTGLGRSSIVKIVRLFEILVVHFIPKLAKIRTFNLFYEGIRFVIILRNDIWEKHNILLTLDLRCIPWIWDLGIKKTGIHYGLLSFFDLMIFTTA